MKRIPPKIGFLVLEKEDIAKLSKHEKRILLTVQITTLVLALCIIFIAGVIL